MVEQRTENSGSSMPVLGLTFKIALLCHLGKTRFQRKILFVNILSLLI